MSGFVSALSTAAEVVSGLASLAFGSSGGVVIGDFSLAGFEVPAQIAFGTHQKITIHKLPGGERVIDLMGPDPVDICWSGMLIDSDPYDRARELQQMAADGQVLPLTWGPFFYSVIIREFTADTKYSQVPYKIACVVVRDESSSMLMADLDLTNSVLGDIATAVAVAANTIQAILQTAENAVALVGILIPGSTALAEAAATLAGVAGTLAGIQAVTETAIGALSIISTVGIESAVTLSGDLALGLCAGAYIGRSIRNLT